MKAKKKNHSEWKSFTSLKFQHQYSEWRLLQKHMAGANQPATHVHKGDPRKPTDWHCMCTEEARRSQLTYHACAQRRPTEVYWLASHVHRGGSQKPTDQPCMCTEAISILFCMTLKAKESLKCCSCPLSKCGMPKLHITLNYRYTTLALYPWFPPHVDSKGKVHRIVKSKWPLQDCSSD